MRLLTPERVIKYMVDAYGRRESIAKVMISAPGCIMLATTSDPLIEGSRGFVCLLRFTDQLWQSTIEKARAEAERAAV
jgi:hypothetical protein